MDNKAGIGDKIHFLISLHVTIISYILSIYRYIKDEYPAMAAFQQIFYRKICSIPVIDYNGVKFIIVVRIKLQTILFSGHKQMLILFVIETWRKKKSIQLIGAKITNYFIV